MAIISEFYKRLRDLCEERNMTVNELVRILDLSSGSPTAWKSGATPRRATVQKIADYFHVSADYLLGNVSEPYFYLDDGRILADINSYETENAPTLTEKGVRSGVVRNMNILRIAGRDGSFEERVLTDDQLATVRAFLNLLPDASDDL